MGTAVRQTVTIQPGGRIEITSPDLPEGAEAEVVVKVNATGGRPRWCLAQPKLTEAECRAARTRFRKACNRIDLGRPTGLDNLKIDEDLAREYGNAPPRGKR
jgi:hypothetical protein